MKKNLFSLGMLTAALMLGGCSNDLDESRTNAESNGTPISFKARVNKQLRAATTAAGITDFVLAAWESGTTPSGGDVLIAGVTVTGSGNTWEYTPLAYWPETALVNFYAYSPAGATAYLEGDKLNDVAITTPSITYKLPGHSENGGTTIAQQQDLLVTNHQSSFAEEGSLGVDLHFRHGLSRILVQAKSESAQDFKVTSIKLKNIKNKGTLDLSTLPLDDAGFSYPTTKATVSSPGYQIFWNTEGGADGDLVADLSDGVVVDGDAGEFTDIIDDDNALYVIPQTNETSDLAKATVVSSADPSTKFYIEISYEEDGSPGTSVTYAVPIPALVGDAYASSIAFEIERQYTFQFELFGRKPIVIHSVDVSDYSEATPQEEPLRVQWAGSNIYWTGSVLTFDDSNDKTHEKYQGLYFKWGSLVGIPSDGTFAASGTACYWSSTYGAAYAKNKTYSAWASIPQMLPPDTGYGLDDHYLTEYTIPDSISAQKGDICKYLTILGTAPAGKRWRMPTATEFATASEYGIWGTGSNASNASGSGVINNGRSRTNLNKPFFPASGYLDGSGGHNNTYAVGYYWSSSRYGHVNGGYNLSIASGDVTMLTTSGRAYSVRCVVE